MSHRSSHAIGRRSGRVGTVVLAGMVAGLLIIAGCRTAAQAERVHMRQELDFVTVNISNSSDSISRARLIEGELRAVYGF